MRSQTRSPRAALPREPSKAAEPRALPGSARPRAPTAGPHRRQVPLGWSRGPQPCPAGTPRPPTETPASSSLCAAPPRPRRPVPGDARMRPEQNGPSAGKRVVTQGHGPLKCKRPTPHAGFEPLGNSSLHPLYWALGNAAPAPPPPGHSSELPTAGLLAFSPQAHRPGSDLPAFPRLLPPPRRDPSPGPGLPCPRMACLWQG